MDEDENELTETVGKFVLYLIQNLMSDAEEKINTIRYRNQEHSDWPLNFILKSNRALQEWNINHWKLITDKLSNQIQKSCNFLQVEGKGIADMPTQLKKQANAKKQIDECATSCYTEIHKQDWLDKFTCYIKS